MIYTKRRTIIKWHLKYFPSEIQQKGKHSYKKDKLINLSYARLTFM